MSPKEKRGLKSSSMFFRTASRRREATGDNFYNLLALFCQEFLTQESVIAESFAVVTSLSGDDFLEAVKECPKCVILAIEYADDLIDDALTGITVDGVQQKLQELKADGHSVGSRKVKIMEA